MGWSHPEISLEHLLNLIKGFIDILILASGYQSSGLQAHWNPHNIKKALQWGLFFENVFRCLNSAESADVYRDSIKELDAALLELKSNPYFPQGLAHLSSSTLAEGRDFVLRHLIHTLPLRNEHLSAVLTAVAEMDLDDLQTSEHDCLNVYLDKLMLQNIKPGECADAGHSKFAIQELVERQNTVSCVLSVEKGLDILCKILSQRHPDTVNSSMLRQKLNSGVSLMKEDMFPKFDAWRQWKSRNLSYLLDKRTVRLVSGAKLIFSAPKVQWIQVFERLKASAECHDDYLLQILELSLLGCVTSRWSHVIEHFMSVSYDLHSISKQYYEVHSLLQGRPCHLHSKDDTINSVENAIHEHLPMLLPDQLHLLWKISPVIAASAIPSWSPLYRLYLGEIDKQFKGDFSPMSLALFYCLGFLCSYRCCSCVQDGSEHTNCELAERIWCLYIFHVKVPSNGQ